MTLRHDQIKLPPELAGRTHLSIQEYRDLVAGKYNKKQTKVKQQPKFRLNRYPDTATYENGVLTITIHEIPPSQNVWKKWHHIALNEETQRWNDLIILLARSALKTQLTNPVVKFKFFFPDHRPRDRKNYESWKPLLDSLTRAGVIADDNYKVISEDKSDIEVDKHNPRTEILVWEGT